MPSIDNFNDHYDESLKQRHNVLLQEIFAFTPYEFDICAYEPLRKLFCSVPFYRNII